MVLQIYHGRFRRPSAELLLAGVDVATFSKAVELALFYYAKARPSRVGLGYVGPNRPKAGFGNISLVRVGMLGAAAAELSCS